MSRIAADAAADSATAVAIAAANTAQAVRMADQRIVHRRAVGVAGAAGSVAGCGAGARFRVLATPRPVLVVGMLGHVDDAQAFGLLDVRPTVLRCERTPFLACERIGAREGQL